MVLETILATWMLFGTVADKAPPHKMRGHIVEHYQTEKECRRNIRRVNREMAKESPSYMINDGDGVTCEEEPQPSRTPTK